jgi:hypothetical protein
MSRADHPTFTISELLEPQPAQHVYLERLTQSMTRREMQETLLVMIAYLDPIARSALLDAAAQVAGVRPFSEWRRR